MRRSPSGGIAVRGPLHAQNHNVEAQKSACTIERIIFIGKERNKPGTGERVSLAL
jgi:hypothetical protein